MGAPEHFSYDLPRRCLQLVEDLLPHAKQSFELSKKEFGPLTTTFILAMAMPIINLPVERIFKQFNSGDIGYADDREINPKLSETIKTVLNRSFKDAPFFATGVWSFSSYKHFNLADGIPLGLSDKLRLTDACSAAHDLATTVWISCLRNALAHGGIAYMDRSWRSVGGPFPVERLAFASERRVPRRNDDGKSIKDENGKKEMMIDGVNVLSVSESDFLSFLLEWGKWVEVSGLAREMQVAA